MTQMNCPLRVGIGGPVGAGKTTLISTICGITVPTSGTITVGGHDTQTDFAITAHHGGYFRKRVFGHFNGVVQKSHTQINHVL